VNSKGEQEEYSDSEVLATLKQVYDRPARGPWANGRPSATSNPATDRSEAKNDQDDQDAEDEHDFFLTEDGVYHTHWEKDKATGKARPVTLYVCSWLDVLACSRDGNSESWGRLLRWRDADGREHSWVVPMGMLVGDGLFFRETLANGGLDIGSHPKLLVQYVSTRRPPRRILCTPQVGWLDRSFVTPEWVIPENSNVAYQTMGRGEHFYRTSGTLEEWIENVSKKCLGNPLLIFSVSCAFAGPLMRSFNVQGGGFALEGESSVGKSTALIAAGSVWGGGGRLGFCRTFAATQTALESIGEIHNDGCLILDELTMCEPAEIEKIIYMLANGFGKGRDNRNLTGRRTMSWLMMILINGEIPATDHAAKAGRRMRGGAEARLAGIPADTGKWGLFEELHDTDNPQVFAETLESAARRYYGTAIRAFLEYFTAHWDETLRECKAFMDRFIQENLPAGAAPEIGRILRRCALAGAVAEKVTEIGITGWPPGEAKKAAIIAFERLIERRGGVEAADRRNAFEQVRGFIASQRSRFRSAEQIPDKKTGDLIPEHVTNSVGYWKEIDGELVYLVDPVAFEKEVCRGFTARNVAKELRKRRLLLLNKSAGFRRWESVTLEGGATPRLPFIPIRAKILEAE
jgi:putative DNA primase/helicase